MIGRALLCAGLKNSKRSSGVFGIKKRPVWSWAQQQLCRFPVRAILLLLSIGFVGAWFVAISEAGVSRYAFHENSGSLSTGAWLSTPDAPAELEKEGDAFRLLLGVDSSGFSTVTSSLVSIDVKGERTCGLTPDSALYCWGSSYTNTPQQFGDNTILGGKKIAQVSNGEWHTCAITQENQLYCWGQNTYGQLGNSSTAYSGMTPVHVDTTGVLAGKTLSAVSAGHSHTCALADGQVYCWGRNNRGQLGDSSLVDSSIPVAVDLSGSLAGRTIQKISSGFYHTCAIDTLGQSYCWGSNNTGQLGNNSFVQSSTPIATDMTGALAGKTVLSISAYGEFDAGHTCVVASDNLAYCWGHNGNGRLGNGSTVNSSIPVAVNTSGVLAGKMILQINAGLRHTCAVASDNRAYCWGYNTYGQTASGQGIVPGAVNTSGVMADKDIVAIGGGARHTCALDTEGRTYCWGYGSYGNLGVGSSLSSSVPVISNAIEYIPENSTELVLQYAEKNAATCSIQADGFINVDDSTPIAYSTNMDVADRTPLGTITSSFIASSLATPQVYVSSGETYFTNYRRIAVDRTAIWDFSLKDNGSPMDTTYCLRIAHSGTGEPVQPFTVSPEITTADDAGDTPYRIYEQSQNIIPGMPLGATDAPATLTNTRDSFRLRAGVGIGAEAGELQYKLQYSPLTTAVCSDQIGGYQDVTSVSPIAYEPVTGIADRTSIQYAALDPVASDFVSPQQFVSSASTPFTNPYNIPVGRTGVWDFSLKDNTPMALAGTAYCLRIVHADGSALDASTAVVQVSSAKASRLNSAPFRIYDNTDTVTPGAPLASTNEQAILPTRNAAFRLRTGLQMDVVGTRQISSGYNLTCSIDVADNAYCWGANWYGQLGNGSTEQSSIPVAIDTSGSLSGKAVKNIAAGNSYACAIASDDNAYCWGANWYGQLGNGSTEQSSIPVAIDTSGSLSGKAVKGVYPGNSHTCAIASDDNAYCWGANWYGQLGNGSTEQSSIPVAVDVSGLPMGTSVKSISPGSSHTCALTSSGQVFCWGRNDFGQLGNNSTVNSSTPVAVDTSGILAGKNIVQITSGNRFSCALTEDAEIACWGYNAYGQLGSNSIDNSSMPVWVVNSGPMAEKTINSISANSSASFACAKSTDGYMFCWGRNSSGQLGDGSSIDSIVPVAVDITGVLAGKVLQQISAGASHSCAIDLQGSSYCWGSNSYGEIGNGFNVSSSVPAVVARKDYRINLSVAPLSLHYARLTAETCSDQLSGFSAVTSYTPIAFSANNSGTADGTPIASFYDDPTDPIATVAQTYVSSSEPFTISRTAPAGSVALFDFSLRDNGAPTDETYCMRVVASDGSVLGSLNYIASVKTSAARYSKPTVDSIAVAADSLVITGTYDANYASTLRVSVGKSGNWYVLGASSELSTMGDRWTLDLSQNPEAFNAGSYDVQVEVVTVDGVVLVDETTDEIRIYQQYLAATGQGRRLFLLTSTGLIIVALCVMVGLFYVKTRHVFSVKKII